MGGYIGARHGTVSATVANVDKVNAQDVTATDTTPEVTIVNTTHEDTDGGREGKVIFKGQQSGGEETTLAEIQGSHDGTADDQKGDLIFRTNDGSDGTSPTEVLRTNSAGNLLITSSDQNGLTLNTTDSNGGFIALKTSGTAKGYIGTSHHLVSGGSPSEDDITIRAEGKLQFAIGATEELRLDSDGLKFNGDTAADNALNDYEEGTFNVAFSGATVSVGSNVANYTKIGNMVYWRYYTGVSTISSSSSSLILGGLPYNVANVHGNYSGVNVGINTFFGSSVTDGQKAYHQISTDYIYFVNPATISSPSAVNGSSKYLMVGGFYQAA